MEGTASRRESWDDSRGSTVGGETEGDMEGRLLSVVVEGLRCNEVEPTTPRTSWESGESAGGGCGC